MSVNAIKNKKNLGLLFTRPLFFLEKAVRKIQTMANQWHIDGQTKAFIKHNRKVWAGWVKDDAEKVILTDFHTLPEIYVASIYFLNILALKYNATIVTFGGTPVTGARALTAVLNAANIRKHIVTSNLTVEERRRCDQICQDIFNALKTKQDVFDIHVDGIHLGIDIYESYLKEFNKPTVYIDQDLYAVIRWAVGSLLFWQDYLKTHDVASVVLSHDTYVHYNVIAKLAYQQGIPVYLPDFFQAAYAKGPYAITARFKSYRGWFEALPEVEKKEAMALAQRQMAKRFEGKKEGDILYDTMSAFQLSPTQERVLADSPRTKVLICSHCFFDNPHAYGGMIFLDFYEWLTYLTKIAEKTDYDWYLKTHPDPLPGTLETIKQILGDNSRIKIIPSLTSHHQLVAEGLDVVLTVYGTVGHEYPAFDVQVVNAGYNPHVAFDFTWTPSNLQEYEEYLFNLPNLKKKIDKNQMYQFYFMHYYYCRVDDLVYNSYRKFAGDFSQGQRLTSSTYAYFLKTWTPEKHARIIAAYSEFIDSGKQFLFIKGPVEESCVPV